MNKALVIFSGGMDSTFLLFHAKAIHDEVELLFFEYGQRHCHAEWKAAMQIAQHTNTPIKVMNLRNIVFSKSPLTDPSKPIEQFANYEEAQTRLHGKIEPAFVPMRNSLFLDIAVNYAMCHEIDTIYIGISQEDGETVPDCSGEWLAKYKSALYAGLGMGEDKRPRINAPLLMLGKPKAIRLALHELPGCYAAMAFSHTSYMGDFPPSRDNATVCREDAFEKAGVPDPLMVRAYLESNKCLIFPTAHKILGGWIAATARALAGRITPREARPDEWIKYRHEKKVTWESMMQFEKLVRESL